MYKLTARRGGNAIGHTAVDGMITILHSNTD